MIAILSSPLMYLFMTVAVYFVFAWLVKKLHTAIFNPLLWTIIVMVGYVLLMTYLSNHELNQDLIKEEVKNYRGSANVFEILLAPVTVALAIPLYENRMILKQYWLAILVATIVGTGTSIGTVFLLGHLLDFDMSLTYALLPRGVTTAIATEVANMLGASLYSPVTVTVVALTGIVGAVLGPVLIKLFRNKDDVVVGLALGSASHAIGTSKAFDYSSRAGAISSVSIVTNGLMTVLVALIINAFVH